MDRVVGPCRYLAASKPRRTRQDAAFFHCPTCGSLLVGIPSPPGGKPPLCCGGETEKLEPACEGELQKKTGLDYQILGGPNGNAVRVTWSGPPPQWLYLETFRGGQYVEPGPRERNAVFAMAGSDAYAYCDKDPCEECSFRCKNGFVLYAYWPEQGLAALPLNRIAAISNRLGGTTRRPPQSQ